MSAPVPDFTKAPADELIRWAAELKAEIDREIASAAAPGFDVKALAVLLYVNRFAVGTNHHARADISIDAAEAFFETWNKRKPTDP